MHILTGVVVSLLLMSMLFLWAYSKQQIKTKASEIIVDICAALVSVSLIFGILLIGHWTAVLLSNL